MTDDAIEKVRERLREAAEGRPDAAAVDAALERARMQVEELAQTAAELEATIPAQVEHALSDGLAEQVRPVGRNLAEIRGLMNQVIRRLERVEGDLLSERHARVDDLGLLVDLITSSWKSVERRISTLERKLQTGEGAILYKMEERRTGSSPRYKRSSTASPIRPSATANQSVASRIRTVAAAAWALVVSPSTLISPVMLVSATPRPPGRNETAPARLPSVKTTIVSASERW